MTQKREAAKNTNFHLAAGTSKANKDWRTTRITDGGTLDKKVPKLNENRQLTDKAKLNLKKRENKVKNRKENKKLI